MTAQRKHEIKRFKFGIKVSIKVSIYIPGQQKCYGGRGG